MSSWSEHFREQKQQAADSAIRNQAHFPLSLSGFSVLLTLCLRRGEIVDCGRSYGKIVDGI